MKRSLKEVGFLTITAVCFPLIVPGAEPVNVATLRYHFAPDTTNAYSLRIESQGEAGREAIEGVYLISTKGVTGNVATLTFKGQLRPKSMPNGPMMMGYRGPGSPMTLASYAMRPQIEGMEITVDDEGNVLRDNGDTPLPVPLGQIMTSLFEKLPTAATNGWDSDKDVNITDDPVVQGPASTFVNSPYGGMGYNYYPGRPGLGILAADLKTKLRATDATNDSITLHKALTLESWMRTGSEPRVSASGDGDIVFNQKSGLPESVELQCKTSVVTENVSRRTTSRLQWKLLRGAEREAALNPPPPPPNPAETEMSAADLAAATEKLKSDEPYNREDAVRRLATAKISSPSPALMSQMIGLINDPSESIDNSALTFVANHATEEQVVLLIKNLNTSDQNTRSAIVRALGRLKDKRAAEPLADVLAMGPTDQLQYNSSRNTEAADALSRIGPAAETAVLGLLKERSNATRWQACGILKRIGTSKSLPALKDLSLASSKELSEAASEAYRAIEAREKK